MENPSCIYCGHPIADVFADYIVLTDSFEWVGAAHTECQCLAISKAAAALRQPRRIHLIETVPLGGMQ